MSQDEQGWIRSVNRKADDLWETIFSNLPRKPKLGHALALVGVIKAMCAEEVEGAAGSSGKGSTRSA